MKKWLAALVVTVACGALTAIAIDAEARRFGGGRNLGVQRQAVPPKQAPSQPPASQPAPSNQAAPGAGAPAQAAPAAAPVGAAASTAAQPRAGMSRWLGPVAGIAAGLGLAALLSHLGLSEAFASFLLIALLAVALILLVRWLLRRAAPGQAPRQYAGAAAGAGRSVPMGHQTLPAPSTPLQRLGAGLSGPATRIEPTLGTAAAVPEGFDAATFLRHAKANFNRLQAAYDSGRLEQMDDLMTPEMFAQTEADIAARGAQLPTEVVKLDAGIVEVKTEGDAHWVGVRFSGLLREDGASLVKPFDEVWNLTKPVDDSAGWQLAGIEQL